ncbi:MAG TPA: hypothetical protein VLX59_10160 [Acidimicrobiales bacterium]|nr:hypothetical protein [Acidimicrobiales bacterium]
MSDPHAQREAAGPASARPPVPPDAGPYDSLDEQEVESFPASDPHSDWAGPST